MTNNLHTLEAMIQAAKMQPLNPYAVKALRSFESQASTLRWQQELEAMPVIESLDDELSEEWGN